MIRSRHDIQHLARDLFKVASISMLRQKQLHASLIYKLRSLSLSDLGDREQDLKRTVFMLRKDVASFAKQKHSVVSNIEKTISNMHPQKVLKRGYTITRLNGKSVMSTAEVKANDVVETVVSDGVIFSEVTTTKKSSDI